MSETETSENVGCENKLANIIVSRQRPTAARFICVFALCRQILKPMLPPSSIAEVVKISQ